MESSGSPDNSIRTRDLDYVELNLAGRLAWETGFLAPFGSTVGVGLLVGGWIGARTRGSIGGEEPRSPDFGQLAGLELFWRADPVLLQVEVRSRHGEVRYWDHGPRTKGSLLLFGLGYRVH